MCRSIIPGLLGFVLCSFSLAGEPAAPPAFAKKPAAAQAGDKVKIDFAVDRETDVAVAILDAQGKTVRHLVAGVLGKNPPAPLKAGSLAQSVEWDQRDDAGKPVAGGPFKVKVSLGLAPKLEEYMFADPGRPNGAECLGMGKDGTLYICGSAGGIYAWNAPGMLMQVFDRQGKYQRTIVPYPPNLPLDKLKGTGAFDLEGRIYPVWHSIMLMRTYPGNDTYGHEMAVTSDGRICKLVTSGEYCLRTINKDGSTTASAPILGPSLAPGIRPGLTSSNRSWIGLSSDEKSVYASGILVRAGDGKSTRLHAVWRAPADGSKPGAVFLGDPQKSGNDEKSFNRPLGVCADGNGLLYVADQGNNRIQVFKEADGSFVGSVSVENPTTVQVHPKTGAIYVLSCRPNGGAITLIKISGRENPKEVCRIPVGKWDDERYAYMVLDTSAEPTYLWIAGDARGVPFKRLEDRGAALAEAPVKFGEGGFSPGTSEDLQVDRNRDELYLKTGTETFFRVDLKTNKAAKLAYPYAGDAAGTALAISPDGNLLYTQSHDSGGGIQLRKFDRDFKPVPFESLGKNLLKVNAPMTFATRGLAVAPNGDIYVIPTSQGRKANNICELEIYKADGSRKGTALWRCSEGITGPRFDPQGNIYVLECVRPGDKIVPDFFKDRLAKGGNPGRGASSAPWDSAAWMYGSVIKFPPTGGIIWYAAGYLPGKSGWGEDVPAEILKLPETVINHRWGDEMSRTGKTKMQGAQWIYYGAAPFTDKCGPYACNCQGARFDVDDYGRSFFPDCGRFRLGVLDTNGNEIAFAGAYGNRDCGGKGSAIPEPEIAFAYPYTVAVSRTHVFVGDLLNHRIAKLKLAYAVEETCDAR
jgi:DNA-binding beta-propeller fold protein YncE